jgi:LmbE family N-acetylglucosaminyl deacetylase/tetratricopeptide (TPR) repeat protein
MRHKLHPLIVLAFVASTGVILTRESFAAVSAGQEQGGSGTEPAGTKPTIESLRRTASQQARARQFMEAIRSYERILAMAPGDTDALSHLAQLEAWTGNYDKAIVLYRDAIGRRPKDLGLKSDLADTFAWANRLEEAEHLYEEVVFEDGNHHEALKGLAHARLLRGDVGGATGVLERALRLYPKDVDLLRDRARMLSQKGEAEKAIEALQQAVQLAPTDGDALRQLAETYQQQRDWPKAIEAWLGVAKLSPAAPGSHVALGRAYLAQGKMDLSREHAGLALRMSPTDSEALQLAAELDRETGLVPLRTTTEWLKFLAYSALLPAVLLVASKTKRALRRRPVAWAFVMYVVPSFLVLKILSQLLQGTVWRLFDPSLFESATEVVLLLGLGVAFVAVLRTEPAMPEFGGEVVLALGAHPDDIELGCAGFLLKLKANGAKVYGLTFTRGEQGHDGGGERDEEARKGAEFLGLDSYWIMDLPDTGLHERISELKAAVESKVKELGVTMVLTHTDVDVHGDHRAVFAAVREAARAVPTVLCYEDVSTGNQFTPNFYVDITNYIEDHVKACALHRTQDHRTYMDPQVIRGRAAHRGMQIGAHFAIAFRTLNLVR